MKTTTATATRRRLTRERIEKTALQLIEAGGLQDFSTRKLGKALGCEAMSIYHHFPSKAHILDALVDRVIAEVDLPDASQPAPERLRGALRAYRGIGLRYPRFAPFLIVHRMESAVALEKLEYLVKACADTGMAPERAARFFRVASYFLMGAILDETQGYAKGPGSLNPVPEEEWGERYPHIAAAGEYFTPEHFEATFELGLDLLLGTLPRTKVKPAAPRADDDRQGSLW